MAFGPFLESVLYCLMEIEMCYTYVEWMDWIIGRWTSVLETVSCFLVFKIRILKTLLLTTAGTGGNLSVTCWCIGVPLKKLLLPVDPSFVPQFTTLTCIRYKERLISVSFSETLGFRISENRNKTTLGHLSSSDQFYVPGSQGATGVSSTPGITMQSLDLLLQNLFL
jgi:hypothetical protein